MPANKPKRPASQPNTSTNRVDDAATARALGDVSAAIRSLEAQRDARVTFVADLSVGDNLLVHHLGRKPSGYTLTATIADASFAHALKAVDDKTITITVVGIDMPGAILEVFASKPTTGTQVVAGAGVS